MKRGEWSLIKQKVYILFVFNLIFLFVSLSSKKSHTDFSNEKFRIYTDDSVGIRAPKDFAYVSAKPTTALHLLYQKERERFEKLSKLKLKPKSKAKSQKRQIRRSIDFTQDQFLSDQELIMRSISLPSSDSKINNYSNMRNLNLSDVAGNINLLNTSTTQFSVNSTSNLNLTLNGNSCLKLRTDIDVTLKADDIINVIGKDNIIEVFGTFYINGSLLFDINSQLTIKLNADNTKVIFIDNTILDLESNVEFKIEGNGIVEFGDGTVINLKGDTSNSEFYPSLIISDFATVMPKDGATNSLKGVGKLILQDGGTLDIRGYSQSKYFSIGELSTDNIDVDIKGKGMIRLEGGQTAFRYGYAPLSGNVGNLSFGNGSFSLTVRLGGILYIGANGWLEINSFKSNLQQGYLKKIDLGPNGNFYLLDGGLFSLAANKNEFLNELALWIAKDANVWSGGIVEYISPDPKAGFNYQGFDGTLQLDNTKFNDTDGIKIVDLVRTLVNQNTTLATAIVYTDNAGDNKVRLKNGAIINITDGDIITGEDTSGNILARSSVGRPVIYKLEGNRQVL